MAAPESRAMHRLGLLGVALLLLAIGVLVAYDVGLSRRVAALEAALARRDKADPLVAQECRWKSRGLEDATAGESRENPCVVSFRRVLQAPQQFDGRWIDVHGYYAHGFEVSALFESEPAGSNGEDPSVEALWVNVALQPRVVGDSLDHVVGVFHRGPAGHLGAYFGELASR